MADIRLSWEGNERRQPEEIAKGGERGGFSFVIVGGIQVDRLQCGNAGMHLCGNLNPQKTNHHPGTL